MEPLVFILAGIAFAFYGSYWTGSRFPTLGSTIGLLFLCCSIMIVHLDLGSATLGDGATSSSAAFLGILWILEFISILLAATLFIAGWISHDHAISKFFFVCLFVPTLVYALFSAMPKKNINTKATQQIGPVQIQQGSKNDGYIWAIDSQFISDKECKNGSPEFLAGCRQGVTKNQARDAN
ncbi:MAG: hypothetical protein ACKVOA_02980 [Methylophilaceae bacterium]